MKKLLLAFLVVIVGMVVYFVIDLNTHTHDPAKTLSKDNEYHWYICKNGCGEQLDKEKHNWDNGIITTTPTPSQSGIRTKQCQDCGALKKEAELIVAF